MLIYLVCDGMFLVYAGFPATNMRHQWAYYCHQKSCQICSITQCSLQLAILLSGYYCQPGLSTSKIKVTSNLQCGKSHVADQLILFTSNLGFTFVDWKDSFLCCYISLLIQELVNVHHVVKVSKRQTN